MSGLKGHRPVQVERVGLWSIAKLDILKAYMSAYASIMNVEKTKWLSAFHYVDAFAGPGLVVMRDDGAEDSEAIEYLSGSPLRALECEPRFDRLWFIDKRESRRASLQEIIDDRQARDRAEIKIGNCNDLLGGIVERLRRTERALCFLDPYGLQLDWTTVEDLAATRKVDVFINFSVMGIVRNLPKDDRPGEEVRRTLGRVMATDSWIDNLYVDQHDLFGGVRSSRRPIDARKLAAIYATDLAGIFEHVSDPIVMTNSRGGPLYALVLASHKSLAKERMNGITRRERKRSTR
jgi:three-Cys-motif partner protein